MKKGDVMFTKLRGLALLAVIILSLAFGATTANADSGRAPAHRATNAPAAVGKAPADRATPADISWE